MLHRKQGQAAEEVGDEVAFFVDEVASPFSMLEAASRRNVAQKREAFVQWARQHVGFSKLVLDDDGYGGNALFAAEDIAEGEEVARIPYSMTISPEGVVHAASSTAGMLAELYADRRVPHEILSCMFLLLEIHAGRHSFFAPYLDLLPPPSKMTTPFYWDEELLSLLSFDSRLAASAERQIDYFERAYLRFFSVIQSTPSFLRSVKSEQMHVFARQPMQWAFALLMSRAWDHMTYTRIDMFRRLIPIADAANHANAAELPPGTGVLAVRLVDHDEGHGGQHVALSLAGGPLQRGQKMYVSYGGYSNTHLFSQYGFTMWPNVHHTVCILNSSTSSPDSERDARALNAAPVQQDRVAACSPRAADCDHGLTTEAWQYFQALAVSQEESTWRMRGGEIKGRARGGLPRSPGAEAVEGPLAQAQGDEAGDGAQADGVQARDVVIEALTLRAAFRYA